MSFRDRLLAHLRAPDYSPANEYELSRRLKLSKKDRGQLAHEVRLLLKSGDFARTAQGRIAPRGREGPARSADTRKTFTPTWRHAILPSEDVARPRDQMPPLTPRKLSAP